MSELSAFLERHGYALLFAILFLEQAGLPLPAVPVLLAAGALAGQGKFNVAASLAIASAACLAADLIWFELGRRRGRSILKLLCKISLEPDTCVRATEDAFERHGRGTLLVAKFVPGLNTVATPLAGVAGIRLAEFLAFDLAGAILYAGVYTGLGLFFHRELASVTEAVAAVGGRVFWLAAAVLGIYLGIKVLQRKMMIRRFRLSRIEPGEVASLIESGADLTVVDLRHPRELEAVGAKLPGALILRPDELAVRHGEIPRSGPIILYCS